MKKFLFILLISGLPFFANAQPTASEGSTDYQKTAQPAAIIELPYAEKIVEKGIKDYMASKGFKDNSGKSGYTVYRSYKLKDTHDYNSDLYFKIERKSRKEKELTVVFLVVGKNGEDVKKRVASDNSSIDGAAALLNNMAPSIAAYNLEVQITEQEENIKKSEKRYTGLVEDQKDLEKRLKALEEKLAENKKDQEKQTEDVKKQKELLETLRSRRKA